MKHAVSALMLSATLAAGLAPADEAPEKAEGPVRHIVLFRFKDTTTPDQTKRIESDFAALPGKIDTIQDFEWGTNNSPEGLSDGYTHAFLVTFADEAGLDVYGPHPDHKAFSDSLGPHRDGVTVIDYVPTVVKALPEGRSGSVLRHVVLFQFKEGTTPDQVREVEEAFSALPEKIDAIEAFEWGTNIRPGARADGFTHAFLLTFADEAGRDEYLPHPDHQAFGKVLGPHLAKVRVIDYTWAP